MSAAHGSVMCTCGVVCGINEYFGCSRHKQKKIRGDKYCQQCDDWVSRAAWDYKHKHHIQPQNDAMQSVNISKDTLNEYLARVSSEPNNAPTITITCKDKHYIHESIIYNPRVKTTPLSQTNEKYKRQILKEKVLPVIDTIFDFHTEKTIQGAKQVTNINTCAVLAFTNDVKKALEHEFNCKILLEVNKYRAEVAQILQSNALFTAFGVNNSLSSKDEIRMLNSLEGREQRDERESDVTSKAFYACVPKQLIDNKELHKELADFIIEKVGDEDFDEIVWEDIKQEVLKSDCFDQNSDIIKRHVCKTNGGTLLQRAYLLYCSNLLNKAELICSTENQMRDHSTTSMTDEMWDAVYKSLYEIIPKQYQNLKHGYVFAEVAYYALVHQLRAPSFVVRKRSLLHRTPSNYVIPKEKPSEAISKALASHVIGTRVYGEEPVDWNDNSDLEWVERFRTRPDDVLFGNAIKFEGEHKNQRHFTLGQEIDIRTALCQHFGYLDRIGAFKDNIPTHFFIELCDWIDGVPCVKTGMQRGSWRIMFDEQYFKEGYEDKVETITNWLLLWASENKVNISKIEEKKYKQLDRVFASPIQVKENLWITVIPTWRMSDYGNTIKMLDCGQGVCPCCGSRIGVHLWEYSEMVLRKEELLHVLTNNKSDWAKYYKIAHDALHILSGHMKNIFDFVSKEKYFDEDLFWMQCGLTIKRNNCTKSSMSSSDWRVVFWNFEETFFKSFTGKHKPADDSVDLNNLRLIFSSLRTIMKNLYLRETKRTKESILEFSVSVLIHAAYCINRWDTDIIKLHLHVLMVHCPRLFSNIALRELSTDIFEAENRIAKSYLRNTNHQYDNMLTTIILRTHFRRRAKEIMGKKESSSITKIKKLTESDTDNDTFIRKELLQHPDYSKWFELLFKDSGGIMANLLQEVGCSAYRDRIPEQIMFELDIDEPDCPDENQIEDCVNIVVDNGLVSIPYPAPLIRKKLTSEISKTQANKIWESIQIDDSFDGIVVHTAKQRNMNSPMFTVGPALLSVSRQQEKDESTCQYCTKRKKAQKCAGASCIKCCANHEFKHKIDGEILVCSYHKKASEIKESKRNEEPKDSASVVQHQSKAVSRQQTKERRIREAAVKSVVEKKRKASLEKEREEKQNRKRQRSEKNEEDSPSLTSHRTDNLQTNNSQCNVRTLSLDNNGTQRYLYNYAYQAPLQSFQNFMQPNTSIFPLPQTAPYQARNSSVIYPNSNNINRS